MKESEERDGLSHSPHHPQLAALQPPLSFSCQISLAGRIIQKTGKKKEKDNGKRIENRKWKAVKVFPIHLLYRETLRFIHKTINIETKNTKVIEKNEMPVCLPRNIFRALKGNKWSFGN